MNYDEPMLQWFVYEKPKSPLESAYYLMAYDIIDKLPRSAERTVALRKLLESKDAAMRASQ